MIFVKITLLVQYIDKVRFCVKNIEFKWSTIALKKSVRSLNFQEIAATGVATIKSGTMNCVKKIQKNSVFLLCVK
jgi:hypothetical protein